MPPGRRRLSHGSGSNRQGSSITWPLLSSAPSLGPRPPLSKGMHPAFVRELRCPDKLQRLKLKTFLVRFSYLIFCLMCSPWG